MADPTGDSPQPVTPGRAKGFSGGGISLFIYIYRYLFIKTDEASSLVVLFWSLQPFPISQVERVLLSCLETSCYIYFILFLTWVIAESISIGIIFT